jgi:hypothetical protein
MPVKQIIGPTESFFNEWASAQAEAEYLAQGNTVIAFYEDKMIEYVKVTWLDSARAFSYS